MKSRKSLSLTEAERLVVAEVVERAHRAGRCPAEWHRRAVETLSSLRPLAAAGPVALNAVAIVLDYAQRLG